MSLTLPPELQQSIDAAQQPTGSDQYAGANASPVTPSTGMPIPPNMGQNNTQNPAAIPAPNIAPPTGTGSLADKISAAYLSHLASQQPTPVKPQQPMSTGQKVMGAVGGIAAGLGDAAHSGDTKGGWLTGVENTLNARNKRLAGDKQQQFENTEQKRKDDVLLATSQAQNIMLHRNMYQQDEDHRQQFQTGNRAYFSQYKETNDLEDGVSQNELYDRMKKNPKFAQDYLARATGEVPVVNADGEEQMDKVTGLPVTRPTYTVMKLATNDGSPATKTVTAEDAAADSKYLGIQYPVGTKLTVLQDNANSLRLAGIRDASSLLNRANGKDFDKEQMDSARPLLSDPQVQHAVSAVPGSPFAGLLQASQNADQHLAAIQQQIAAAQKAGDQQGVTALQAKAAEFTEEKGKIQSALSLVGQKQKESYMKQHGDIDERLTEMEKGVATVKSIDEAAALAKMKPSPLYNDEQKARLAAINQQASSAQAAMQGVADKKKQGENAISNLTGSDYLQTLPTAQRTMVQAVGEGRQLLPANRKEALGILEQVHQAYPDFDESKVKTWQKANNEYRGSGKTATLVVPAYNTALEHMQDLYGNTTADGIFNPLSKAYQDREVALGYVSREVGKAISAGALTQKEGEDMLSDLKGGLTPALKRERITKTAQLLHDKIDEYQTKFQESAPSSAVKVPLLISPKAAASYDYVSSGGQQVQSQPQAPQLPPAAVQQLKEGQTTTFANGQSWTLRNGQPVQVQGVK
jgi:hypothetical protein